MNVATLRRCDVAALAFGYKLGRNRHPLPYALAGVAVIIGAIVWMKPYAPDLIAGYARNTGATGINDYQQVQNVLEQRCYQCHGAQLRMKNVRLDSPQLARQHAQAIYQQVVVTRLMPINNATGITEAERGLLKQWFEAGAKTP